MSAALVVNRVSNFWSGHKKGRGFWEVGHTSIPNFSWSIPLGILKWFINKCWTEFKFYHVITAVALSCKLLSIN